MVNFVRISRQILGISQTDLAKKVYGNAAMRSYISATESGKKDISVTTLGHILTALNADIAFTE